MRKINIHQLLNNEISLKGLRVLPANGEIVGTPKAIVVEPKGFKKAAKYSDNKPVEGTIGKVVLAGYNFRDAKRVVEDIKEGEVDKDLFGEELSSYKTYELVFNDEDAEWLDSELTSLFEQAERDNAFVKVTGEIVPVLAWKQQGNFGSFSDIVLSLSGIREANYEPWKPEL